MFNTNQICVMLSNPFQHIHEELTDIKAMLSDAISKSASNEQPKQRDSGGVEVAIEETGLSKSSVYRLVHLRQIPHSKQGGRLYFSRKALREWIAQGSR